MISSLKFIFCICVVIAVADCESNRTKIDLNTEWPSSAQFVATTPRIDKNHHDSSEDEDDDDFIGQQNLKENEANSYKPNTLALIFNTISNEMIKTALSGMRKNSRNSDRNVEQDLSNNTDSFQGRQAGPSYIKGDPLNGYYDFVITEGSYKFWVVFQLFTAALLIYSTLAAIYYSKVNPLTSDYDYIDYLSRSFHGRSLDSEDVETNSDDFTVSKNSYLSSLEHNKWVKTAAYGFQFAMDAIDRIPK